ncbi:polymer-forming cytoskeletal protein [Jeotgalibacillus sp. R-1-5s-1]|uniref:DUF7305 domain-containing protein n=1 Tax=Jeotgalibacillus sp. R-1-5s-1 TaxID=2555897 RepID=UPI00106C3047|nr:polymer-forming cytoskeletal protein [Jeotgalibacillus sp. R-1-5s-1]TFD99556.1 hypothetical protein E2491_07545 [Jeotgalibacillus sp. R-1-5s-1]
MKRYANNQEGYSLLLTIFAVTFISIIAVSILSFTSMTTSVSVNERDHQSSYYIAEAGLVEKRAELNAIAANAYQEVKAQYDALDPEEKAAFNFTSTFYSRVQSRVNEHLSFTKTVTYEEQQSVTPVSTTEVTQISTSPLTYEITSTGTIPGKNLPGQTKELSQQVQVQMNVNAETELVTIPGSGGETVKYLACYSVYATGDFYHNGKGLKGPIYADGNVYLNKNKTSIDGNVYAKGNVTLNGGEVDGDIYSEKRVYLQNKKSDVTGQVFENTSLAEVKNNCVNQAPALPSLDSAFPATNAPMPPDSDSIKNGILSVGTNQTLVLNQDIYLKEINIDNKVDLTFDLKGQNRRVFIDDLNLKNGNIKIKNPGKLELIVQDHFSVNGNGEINTNGNKDHVEIRYAGNKDLKFTGNTSLTANLHVKDANLDFKGNNSIGGDLFVYGAANITTSGNSDTADRLILAPKSDFFITGNGNVNGNLIVKDFNISGSGSTNPPKSDYGEWEGPSAGTPDQEIEIIRYADDGSFLKADELSEQ